MAQKPAYQYDPSGHSKQLYYSKSRIMNWVHAAHINAAVATSAAGADRTIADIGCSDGEYLVRLGGQYRLAVGIDHNPESLKTLQQRINNERVSALQSDACRLPFPNETFDVVCCLETLEHVYNMPAAVAEMKRILKPEGALVITVPIERGPSILLKQGVAKLFFGGYRGSYTWTELWNAALGRMEKVPRLNLSSHKGFDYQTVLIEAQKHFTRLQTHGLPFKPLSTWLNTQFFICARDKR